MNTFLKILAFIAVVVFISFISSSIAESFDIEFALYGSYVIWILALCLLYMVLPVKPISIFSGGSSGESVKKMETQLTSAFQPPIVGGNSIRNYKIPVPIELPPLPPKIIPNKRVIMTTNENKLYEYNITS